MKRSVLSTKLKIPYSNYFPTLLYSFFMNEWLKSKDILLQAGNISVVSCGYDPDDWQKDSLTLWAREAAEITYIANSVFHPNASHQFLNRACNWPNIQAALREVATTATSADTLLFYYAGHGYEKSLDFPNENDTGRTTKKKTLLADELLAFPGKKILLFNCCNGFFFPDIPNTIIAAPSQKINGSYGTQFHLNIYFNLMHAENSRNPFHSFVTFLLEDLHNRPYGPRKGDWIQSSADPLDDETYQMEKKHHQPLLVDYQRAAVRSTLVQDGVIFDVDPACYF